MTLSSDKKSRSKRPAASPPSAASNESEQPPGRGGRSGGRQRRISMDSSPPPPSSAAAQRRQRRRGMPVSSSPPLSARAVPASTAASASAPGSTLGSAAAEEAAAAEADSERRAAMESEPPQKESKFEIERELAQLEKERASLLKRKSQNRIPRFIIQDNVNVLALQMTHVSRAIFGVIFHHMDKIYKAYVIYFAASIIIALYVAAVGTLFSKKCELKVILFLVLYGYLNLVAGILTSVFYRFYCELVIIMNLVVGFLNHTLLLYGVLLRFDGLKIKDYDRDDCHRMPTKSADGLLGFLGVVTVIYLFVIYGSLIYIIAKAWKAKINRTQLIEERRHTLQDGVTHIYI